MIGKRLSVIINCITVRSCRGRTMEIPIQREKGMNFLTFKEKLAFMYFENGW